MFLRNAGTEFKVMQDLPRRSWLRACSGSVDTSERTACFENASIGSMLWNRFHICKSFQSCWIRSCYTPPGLLATFASRCGSRGLGVGGQVATRIARGRIARGQIARGEVRLYKFAAPDKTLNKKRLALVLTRNSAIAYLSTVTVAPVTSPIRGELPDSSHNQA